MRRILIWVVILEVLLLCPPLFADEELMKKYEPFLFFHKEAVYKELFYPMDVEAYISKCSLWYNQPVIEDEKRRDEGTVNSELLATLGKDMGDSDKLYLKFVEKYHPFALEPLQPKEYYWDYTQDALVEYLNASPKYTYYFRQFIEPDYGYLVLQYWFFYAFNSWGAYSFGYNIHEGDWESITIFLHPVTQQPVYVAYSAHHDKEDKVRRRWDEIRKTGTHPMVFAALGSHANYFEPKFVDILVILTEEELEAHGGVFFDRANGSGMIIGPLKPEGAFEWEEWEERVILETHSLPDWAKFYNGKWGMDAVIDKFGFTGPRFPPFQSDSDKWYRPAKWAGIKEAPSPVYSTTFKPGQQAQVISDIGLKLRSSHEKKDDENVIDLLPKDAIVTILDHPDNGIATDGYYWWYVQHDDKKGWCVEADYQRKEIYLSTPGPPAPQLPDLIVENIWLEPSLFYPSDDVEIYARIKNSGDADADGFSIEVYFDGDRIKSDGAEGLAAGFSTSLPSPWSYKWASDTVQHTIKVNLDPDNQVEESNEGNNELSSSFSALPLKTTAEIKIEDADTVWEASLTPSEALATVARTVSPRIIAEYADFSFSRDFIEPKELSEAAKSVSPRVIVECADSIFSRDFIEPKELSEAAKSVSPRVIVEYADLSFSQNLQKPEGLESIAKTVSPRIIVEYADSVFSMSLLRFSADGVAERTLSITSVEASPGGHTIVQLSITDATGVSAGDIFVKYDADVITVGEVKGTDLISGISLIVNKDVPGEIKLSMAGIQGISSGSGAVVDIELVINGDAQDGAETTLEFGDTEIYDESGTVIPINLASGVVKITQQGIKGDVNNDGKIRSNDALLALRIAAGLMEPTDYQKWAADMNGDGKIRSNDALLILRKAAGLAAPDIQPVAAIGRTITVMLREAHGVAGESITVPLNVDNIHELAGGNIRIDYDRTVLRAVDVSSDSDVLLASNIAEAGMVRIAFASADRLNDKTVAEIRFDILADDISPLTLQEVELYQSDALPVDSRTIDGQFSSWAIPPEHSALLQNFPNPFNPDTWIPYQLKEESEVTIRIYSVAGDLVRELELGQKPAGLYVSRDRAAYWDGKNKSGTLVASGVYFYSIKAGDFAATRKMVIMK